MTNFLKHIRDNWSKYAATIATVYATLKPWTIVAKIIKVLNP